MNTSNNIEWIKISLGEHLTEPPISVSKYPITVSQYNVFIKNGGYENDDLWSKEGLEWKKKYKISKPNYWMQPDYKQSSLPITGVSFWEAEAFSIFSGGRIPTEREWFLISSNNNTTKYPWGNDNKNISQTKANLAFFGEYRESKRTPVNNFPLGQSKTGVFDLIGNISEWCTFGRNQRLNEDGLAVLKGGCCWHTPISTDSSSFDEVYPNTRDNQTGIRVILGISELDRIDKKPMPYLFNDKRTVGKDVIERPTTQFRQEGIPTNLNNGKWTLSIHGLVLRTCKFSINDLKSIFSKTTQSGRFICVCRWGEDNIISGVLLKDIVDYVGLAEEIDKIFILQKSMIGSNGKQYESTISLKDAIDNNALLCYEMDGVPLTTDLGKPLRLITFHLYGYKQVKCLSELIFISHLKEGWWEKEAGYDIGGKIQKGTITLLGKNRKAKRVDI